jgi:hypothetical protein
MYNWWVGHGWADCSGRNERSGKTNCEQGHDTIIYIKDDEQMLIINMNNEWGSSIGSYVGWDGGDIVSLSSCPAAEDQPESSSLSTMPIIKFISPLNLAVVPPHNVCGETGCTPCSIIPSVLILSIQERVGRDKCRIRKRNDAFVSVLVPVGNRRRGVRILVRCGETAVSSWSQ